MSGAFSVAATVLGLVIGYGLGSIPFGLLLTRIVGLGDIRAIGSGNIGATNVLRTGRKGLAALTLLCDALKGTAPVLIAAALFGRDAALAAAAGAFLGHCFPVWLGFRGGKGVATFIGCLIGLDWRAALAFALVWLAVALATRYSSLASLLAALAAPLAMWVFGEPRAALVLACIAGVLWVRHHANIGRLITRTEGRIGQKA